MLTRPKIWKYELERRRLDKEMNSVEAQAQQRNDPTISEGWYAENRWRFEENFAVLNGMKTQQILKQAEKYLLPIPPKKDENGKWVETALGAWVLSSTGRKELRASIQKARRDSIEWRLKVVGGVIVILTGLFALAAHLGSLRKSNKPNATPGVTVSSSQPGVSSPGAVKTPLNKHSTGVPRHSPGTNIQQHSEGANSPNIVGDNNQVTITAPPGRTLSEEQKSSLQALLKSGAPQELYFVCAPDVESTRFGDEIISVLNAAGWKTVMHPYNWGSMEHQSEGVQIWVADVKKPAPNGAVILQLALKKIGVDAVGAEFFMIEEGKFALYVGLQPIAKK
jgi:hypothetical protein